MRTCYIVSYDISDEKRLRRVFKAMRGFGDHLQYSVFRCDLSATEKTTLIGVLDEIIHHDEDQVLLISLGPSEGKADGSIAALGRPYTRPERHAVVI